MKAFKKNGTLVGQSKSHKVLQKHGTNLRKNTTLYFQIGLILSLLASYGLLEMEFTTDEYLVEIIEVEDNHAYIDTPIFKEEFIKTPIKSKPQPKKQVITKIEEVPDDTTIKKIEKNIITEPGPDHSAELNPEDITIIDDPTDEVVVPFVAIQKAPIYPGCEKFLKEDKRKQCFSDRIGKLVSKTFDQDLINQSGLTGKQSVNVQFKIDKEGNVVDIKARALHLKLQNEAIKVIKKLPQMIPGQQNNQKVEVIYNLPILLKTQN